MACTVDCLDLYKCGEIKKIPPGAVYTPYVSLTLGGEKVLSTGNKSAPGIGNHAVIKSFEYGCSTGTGGCGIKMEIIDEGGVLYQTMTQKLNKAMTRVFRDTQDTSIEFGWIIKDCNNMTTMFTNISSTGRKLYFNPRSLQTNFEGGVIKFIFEATDFMNRMFETRLNKPFGDEADKMPLKQALQLLFTETDPPVRKVEFRGKQGEGTTFDFKNSDGGPNGPKGTWPTNLQNAITIARSWLNSVTTKDGNGILIIFDPSGPDIIFQEDPFDKDDCCSGSIGTYIVNGGNCSPVLSFNPSVKWNLGGNGGSGANTGGATTGDNSNQIEPKKNVEKTGNQSGPTTQTHESQWRNPDDQPKKNAEAFVAHLDATNPYEVLPGIEGELKIVGDPTFDNPVFMTGKWVSIVVINPFYVNQCEWITKSNCNRILSNKKWLILGASHQISEGSYTTTLKLSLPTPNQNIDAGDPLGGSGCGQLQLEGMPQTTEVRT